MRVLVLLDPRRWRAVLWVSLKILLLVLILTTVVLLKGRELLELLVFLVAMVVLVLVLLRVEDFVEVLHDLDSSVSHFVRNFGRRRRRVGVWVSGTVRTDEDGISRRRRRRRSGIGIGGFVGLEVD